MLRLLLTFVMLAALVALPGVAVAQDNSGLDAYQEGTPDVPGGNGGGGNDGAGSDPGAGSRSAGGGGAGTASSDVAGDGSGAGAAGLSEAEAGARGGQRPGELPATGLDATGLMALVGLLLLTGGIVARRAASPVA